jgi:hypothetical protein
MVLYDSKERNNYLKSIRKYFGNEVEIIDPAKFTFSHHQMEPYYKLINSSDVVIYIPLMKWVTAGVYDEIKHALYSHIILRKYLKCLKTVI